MQNTHHGSCLCGEIRYEVDRFDTQIAHCHCRMCRKFNGAAFATFASVSSKDFRWTHGQELLRSYTAENGTTRQFCAECGSSLTFSSPLAPKDTVEIALGTLDSDAQLKPNAHIYVAFKAPWFDITDTLPRYSEGRDSETVS